MLRPDEFYRAVRDFDIHLDEGVSQDYKDQPLAQDWARASKVIEELGESIAELISYTGQNPRKERDLNARDKMLDELADVVLTATYCIQHFTKNEVVTQTLIEDRLMYHGRRVGLR